MPSVSCQCGRVINYKPENAGKRARCGGCQAAVPLPAEEVVTELEVVEEDDPRPARRPTSTRVVQDPDDRPRRRARPRDDEDEDAPIRLREDEDEPDDRPRRRPRRRDDEEEEIPRRSRLKAPAAQGSGLARMMEGRVFWFVAVPLVLGIVSLAAGIREGILGSTARAVPRTVTLAQLAAEGPGSNSHVIVTDYACGENYAVSVKKRKFQSADSGTWESAYVPLIPRNPGLPPGEMWVPVQGGQVRVVMLSHKARNQNDLESMLRSGRVQGLLINSVTSLDSKIQELLRNSYPGSDMSKVLILEQGKEPWGAGLTVGLVLLGGVLIVVALGLGLVALLNR